MSETTKERIINAANRVMKGQGFSDFTLEKVAMEAGISKGGLLHHYPSKDALILGMLEQLNQDFEKSAQKYLPSEGEITPKMHIKAWAEANFDLMETDTGSVSSLLAAVASSPHLLEGLKCQEAIWLDLCATSKDPIWATILGMAMDGMLMSALFGLENFDPKIKTMLKERLLQEIDEKL